MDVIAFLKSRVSVLFSTESAMMARAAKAAAAGLMVEMAMTDKFRGRDRDFWGYPDIVTVRLLVVTLVSGSIGRNTVVFFVLLLYL